MAEETKPVADAVATPEGDNEFAPDQPLTEVPDGLQEPLGSGPDAYKKDKES
ncbi:hypothetical protein [Granulicella tundricola]|uniref:Putative transcriptional regulator, AsnC family n=1 Tax=Granulicella tundricola (strain ATCC BAA-1859 / DSM 23138 / MP5ACTX9) TaxID=1198114 RepID=E8WYN4_GRATM|nr:hypothetical protein [Granulicella tundricola]ADW67632.1 putative transcriptional regulator, AsnC family [Granulicella tundricola MP5ACTX9]